MKNAKRTESKTVLRGNRDILKYSIRKVSKSAQFDVLSILLSLLALFSFRL